MPHLNDPSSQRLHTGIGIQGVGCFRIGKSRCRGGKHRADWVRSTREVERREDERDKASAGEVGARRRPAEEQRLRV